MKKERENEKKILCEIRQLEEGIDQHDENITLQNELGNQLAEKQQELQTVRLPKIMAAMKRCKSQYYEEGEKPSKLFFDLERKNYISKLITRLEINGEMIENPSDILQEQKSFYKDLYSTKSKQNDSSEIDYFLNDKWIKKLTE